MRGNAPRTAALATDPATGLVLAASATRERFSIYSDGSMRTAREASGGEQLALGIADPAVGPAIADAAYDQRAVAR
jgi:hypothetical protein